VPVRAAYLGAGMDSTAFEVNARWIFRFPMRVAVERQLFVERALLPVIAPRLPLAIPAFTFAGAPDVDFPMHFAGYAKLAGKPAVEIDPSRVSFDSIAPQLGRFLSGVHRFPIGEAKRLGAETSRLEDYFEEVRESALAGMHMLQHIASHALADRVQRYLEKLRPLSVAPWPLTLTHHDLAAEHILLDEAGANVTGVIDWGDVGIVDPTVDFVGLFTWAGVPFVRAVLASYDGPVDERVLERVQPWAAFRAIQDIRFGLDNNLPEIVRMGVRALESELLA
jgi:aminoglycoside phosphotransferase (APT) family kinase protein